MKILIQNSSDVPIYQQIYDQMKEAILSGAVVEGELLPSIRQLARELKVSVITTTRAYADLEKENYIMIVQGKGCYVNKINQLELEEKLMKSIENHVLEIKRHAKLLKKSDDELMKLLKIILEEETHYE